MLLRGRRKRARSNTPLFRQQLEELLCFRPCWLGRCYQGTWDNFLPTLSHKPDVEEQLPPKLQSHPPLRRALCQLLQLTRGMIKLCVSSKRWRLSRALWTSDECFLWMPCGVQQGKVTCRKLPEEPAQGSFWHAVLQARPRTDCRAGGLLLKRRGRALQKQRAL